MSRLIDADALEYDTEWSEYHDGFTAYSQMAIDTAPSIDIVRCKECKHWCKGDEVYGICYRCPNTRQMRYDDFCSYGSRSEKPNNCETCKWWEEDTSFCYSKADSDDHACHYERSSE